MSISLSLAMAAAHARHLPLVDGPITNDQYAQLRSREEPGAKRAHPGCRARGGCRTERCRLALTIGRTVDLLIRYYAPNPMAGIDEPHLMPTMPLDGLVRQHPHLRADAEQMLVTAAGAGLDAADQAWLLMMASMIDPTGATEERLIAIGPHDPHSSIDPVALANDDCKDFGRYACDALSR